MSEKDYDKWLKVFYEDNRCKENYKFPKIINKPVKSSINI